MQLRELLAVGGTLDWSGDSGFEAFNSLFRSSPSGDFLSLRDAQMSADKAALAAELARGRDVLFVGSLLDRAIAEGFTPMATMLLEEHAGASNRGVVSACGNCYVHIWNSCEHQHLDADVMILHAHDCCKTTRGHLFSTAAFQVMLVLCAAEERDSDGNTLLMHATINGWDYVVKHLAYLDSVDINTTNNKGQTAIQLAVDRVCSEASDAC